MKSDSFEGWTEQEKKGYLTACITLQKYLDESTPIAENDFKTCVHEFIQTDNHWSECTKCGVIAPTYIVAESEEVMREAIAFRKFADEFNSFYHGVEWEDEELWKAYMDHKNPSEFKID